jgi:hypothetical protein
MPTRTVNITLIRNGSPLTSYDVTVNLITSVAFTEEGVVPTYPTTLTTDGNGEASIDVDVPTNGAWVYRFTFSDGNSTDVAIEAGDPIDLRDLLTDPSVATGSTGATLHPALTVTMDQAANAFTAASQDLELITPLALGNGSARVWRYEAADVPPADAATLQAASGVADAVAAGHLCITSNGDIYKCTDAANQAALVWVKALFLEADGGILLITSSVSQAAFFANSGNHTVRIQNLSNDEMVVFGKETLGAFDPIAQISANGVLEFLGAAAATNRNAQLTELFASIPTSAGASGTLWNDGGTIKKVP